MKNKKPIGYKYSFDAQNRKPFPGKSFSNFIEKMDIDAQHKTYNSKLYDEAIKYCEKVFTNYRKLPLSVDVFEKILPDEHVKIQLCS